jgi:phage tail sheath protein FI
VPVSLDLTGLGGSADTLAADLAAAIFGSTILSATLDPNTALTDRQVGVTLDVGSDGLAPDEPAFEAALAVLESTDDVSIVAAPGASSGWGGDATSVAQAVNGAVTTHCERLFYRVAALDTPAGFAASDVLDFRNLRSSEYAALYYPWVTVSHPIDGSRVSVPPAAYMAGIWARTDSARGVFKAPANEVVRSALDLETRLNKAQQELLNPEGINCLRFFPGPGFLVWGARTLSDDPEWKYLSIRRYFNYLEKSIDEGTQWVVFEVNGPALWDAVRHTVEGFLLGEWRSGALLGAKPEQGFFVRCDASTMTADDLDNGRLVCVIGVAAAKPAEFVIFRISQITAPTS